MCSRPTFVSRTTGASTTFVASSRPPSPASTTAASTLRSAKCANAAAVSVSNCVAPTASAAVRTRATARSKDIGVGVEPLVPAAHVRRRVRADLEAVGAQTARRSCASPSTCRSCRRRAPSGTRAAGCRARRGARACARGRTPPATARATRPTPCCSSRPSVVVLVAAARTRRSRRARVRLRSCSRPGASHPCSRAPSAQRASACTIARA